MAANRYSRVAIALHWLIALSVIAMVPMGLWMSDAIADPAQQQAAYQAFQLHKSIGLTILVLTLFRLGWRLSHPVPPLPHGMKTWERLAARGTHAAFYALMLALPLTGWIYVSTGWSAPMDQPLGVATSWFGLVGIPHLPGIVDAPAEVRREIPFQALGAHSLMAWGGVVLFFLHAGAALKHYFIDRDGVLAQMLPFLARAQEETAHGTNGTRSWAWAPGILLALGLGIAGWNLSQPTGPVPDQGAAPAPAISSPIDTAVTPGTAHFWTIDHSRSAIAFAGTHAGAPFTGRFEDWEGHIWFNPDDLEGSRATVLVRVASARTGDATQEGSLNDGEWFDPGNFPIARFDADSFARRPDGQFEATGILRIKNATVPVVLAFSYVPTGNMARVEGQVALDRTALDLGMASDAGAQWISRLIDVTISVTASRE